MHFYTISERKYSLLFLKVSKSFQQLCEPVASLPQIFGQRIQSWGRQVHSSWKCSHLDLFLFLWTHHLLLLFPLSMFQLSQPSNNYHIAWLLTPTTTSCTSSSPTSASRTGTSPSPAAAPSVQHLFNKFCKLEMIHGAQNATLFIWSNVCSGQTFVIRPVGWQSSEYEGLVVEGSGQDSGKLGKPGWKSETKAEEPISGCFSSESTLSSNLAAVVKVATMLASLCLDTAKATFLPPSNGSSTTRAGVKPTWSMSDIIKYYQVKQLCQY